MRISVVKKLAELSLFAKHLFQTSMLRKCSATFLRSLFAISSLGLLVTPSLAQSATLDNVRARGEIVCGVNRGLKGFAEANSLGDYSGLDADFCRAVSSAVFDDPTAVKFIPLRAGERFIALSDGTIDVLARNTSWTMSRNIKFGEFVGVNYYDGQGFMVPRSSNIRSSLQLDNRTICVLEDTTSALNAKDFFASNSMRYRPVFFVNNAQINQAYADGRCVAMSTDRSGLAAARASFDNPEAHIVLPEVISKEPLGPVVRHGDAVWSNVVRWTLNCMINAEEAGINSNNINSGSGKNSPVVSRLLGETGDFGSSLGLSNEWCANVIMHMGNYAETYERNVGENTAVGLPRGINKLWTDGGLMYAPPIR